VPPSSLSAAVAAAVSPGVEFDRCHDRRALCPPQSSKSIRSLQSIDRQLAPELHYLSMVGQHESRTRFEKGGSVDSVERLKSRHDFDDTATPIAAIKSSLWSPGLE